MSTLTMVSSSMVSSSISLPSHSAFTSSDRSSGVKLSVPSMNSLTLSAIPSSAYKGASAIFRLISTLIAFAATFPVPYVYVPAVSSSTRGAYTGYLKPICAKSYHSFHSAYIFRSISMDLPISSRTRFFARFTAGRTKGFFGCRDVPLSIALALSAFGTPFRS